MVATVYPIFLQSMSRQSLGISIQQERYAENQLDMANEGKSGFYSHLDAPGEYISSEIQIGNTDNYKTNDTFFSQRLKSKQGATSQIKGIVSELLTYLSRIRTDTGFPNSEFQSMINIRTGQISNQLNTQFNNEYIFSGTLVDTAATVDLTTLIAFGAGTLPDLTYNQGNAASIPFQPTQSATISDSMTSALPCFQQVVCALRLLKGADPSSPQDPRFSQAYSWLKAGFDGLNAAEANLNLNIQVVEDSKDYLDDNQIVQQLNLQDFLDSPTEILRQLTANETLLEISQSIFLENIKSYRELSKALEI